MQDIFRKFFKDDKDRLVLGQAPNAPLIGWALFLVLMHISPAGRWQLVAGFISFGFIFTWAWLELTKGVNHFRRLLGLAILIVSIYSKLK